MIVDKPASPLARFIFAHGAGAGMESSFMHTMAEKLLAKNIEVVRFNFPYMQRIVAEQKRRPPDKMPALISSFQQCIKQFNDKLPLFIGGKSMGSRVSAYLANDNKVKGVVCFGYPFHPQNKPEKLRLEVLQALLQPTLVIQGERDKLGSKTEIAAYDLPDNIKLSYLDDGDHDLKPRKASGFSHQQHLSTAADLCVNFIKSHI